MSMTRTLEEQYAMVLGPGRAAMARIRAAQPRTKAEAKRMAVELNRRARDARARKSSDNGLCPACGLFRGRPRTARASTANATARPTVVRTMPSRPAVATRATTKATRPVSTLAQLAAEIYGSSVAGGDAGMGMPLIPSSTRGGAR